MEKQERCLVCGSVLHENNIQGDFCGIECAVQYMKRLSYNMRNGNTSGGIFSSIKPSGLQSFRCNGKYGRSFYGFRCSSCDSVMHVVRTVRRTDTGLIIRYAKCTECGRNRAFISQELVRPKSERMDAARKYRPFAVLTKGLPHRFDWAAYMAHVVMMLEGEAQPIPLSEFMAAHPSRWKSKPPRSMRGKSENQASLVSHTGPGNVCSRNAEKAEPAPMPSKPSRNPDHPCGVPFCMAYMNTGLSACRVCGIGRDGLQYCED